MKDHKRNSFPIVFCELPPMKIYAFFFIKSNTSFPFIPIRAAAIEIVRQPHSSYEAAVEVRPVVAAELERVEKSMVVEEVVDLKALEHNYYPEFEFDLRAGSAVYFENFFQFLMHLY